MNIHARAMPNKSFDNITFEKTAITASAKYPRPVSAHITHVYFSFIFIGLRSTYM